MLQRRCIHCTVAGAEWLHHWRGTTIPPVELMRHTLLALAMRSSPLARDYGAPFLELMRRTLQMCSSTRTGVLERWTPPREHPVGSDRPRSMVSDTSTSARYLRQRPDKDLRAAHAVATPGVLSFSMPLPDTRCHH